MAITERDLELIIIMWNNGKSAREIGAQFGVSRNSIVGLIYRARASGKEVAIKNPDSTRAKLLEKGHTKPHYHMRKRTRKNKRNGGQAVIEPTICTLEPHHCRYPTKMSENNVQIFCGQQRFLNSPYCQKHHELCMNKVKDMPGHIMRIGPTVLKFT